MRLIKCHIENFGKFSNFDYQFSDGINVINENNGWGKTTLSIFIKAMFYGMSGARRTCLDDNDRKMYFPAVNARFGGYIEFQRGGILYRLERFFGKTESQDTCLLTDLTNGKTYSESDKKWGERLFHINLETFLRTTFLSQKDIDLSENTVIADEIGVVDPIASEENFAKAINSLEKKRKELLYKTGKGGKIHEKKMLVADINERLEGCQRAFDGVAIIEKEINAISNEIKSKNTTLDEVVQKEKKAREYSAIVERIKNRNDKLAQKQQLQSELDKNMVIVGDSDVTSNEIKNYLTENAVVLAIEKEIAENNAKIQIINEKRKSIASKYPILPSEKDYQDLNYLARELATIEVDDLKSSNSIKETKKSKITIPTLILSALVMMVGIVVAFFALALGIVFAVVGFLGLIGGFVAFVLQQLKANNEKLSQISQGKEFSTLKRNKIENDILKIKSKLGIFDKELGEVLAQIKTDIDFITNCDNLISGLVATNKEKSIVVSDKKSTIEEVLKGFALPTDYKLKTISEKLNKILDVMSDINAIEDKILTINKDVLAIESKGIKFDGKIEDYNVEDLDKKEILFKKELEELTIKRQVLLNNRKNMYLEQEKFEELSQEKAYLLEEIVALQSKVKIIDKTIEHLTKARTALTEKYLEPLTNRLYGYLSKLSEDNAVTVISNDYKILVEIGGELRSVDYCSKGWKSIYLLALRFAFSDEIFAKNNKQNPNEKPFIMLDDPFVNYDQGHLEKALSALRDFSKDRQIIYFTCHNSRAKI